MPYQSKDRTMWRRNNRPAEELPEFVIPEELKEAALAVRKQGLQNDLLALASRIRNEAPPGSPDFDAGVDWAVLWLENMAKQLTAEEPGPGGIRLQP